jgi:hypothetical protein
VLVTADVTGGVETFPVSVPPGCGEPAVVVVWGVECSGCVPGTVSAVVTDVLGVVSISFPSLGTVVVEGGTELSVDPLGKVGSVVIGSVEVSVDVGWVSEDSTVGSVSDMVVVSDTVVVASDTGGSVSLTSGDSAKKTEGETVKSSLSCAPEAKENNIHNAVAMIAVCIGYFFVFFMPYS